ncbi:MAG: acyltransferase family protein, partial [Oscillospiraceae bacterium]
MDINISKERIVYLDLLRIFSIFCMILLHVSASKWYTTSVNSFEWQVLNIYDILVRFCVPVFVMISGAFFLDANREYTIKKLFSKNILRIIVAFIFWSA